MNSRVSWSVEGIDPYVRERAEAAARNAGMSLGEWLNSNAGDLAPRDSYGDRPGDGGDRSRYPASETADMSEIHARLDTITRQIDQISRGPARQETARQDSPRYEPLRQEAPRRDPVHNEPAVASQLNDAISRLDARLSQISNTSTTQQARFQDEQRQIDMVERAANQVYRPSPPLSPNSMDFAIEEIAARQNELDSAPRRSPSSRTAPPPMPQPVAPQGAAGPDLSVLERHLLKITSQIEALNRPNEIEQSIAAFRGELAQIRLAITEAMPRKAFETIENEIRSLSRRIDDTRQSGTDMHVLANLERALSEIREALYALKPAEQLAGYDEAIRNLTAKLDQIVRSNDDPGTIRKLEDSIAALRTIVSNVASNDALARLSDNLHTLSSKVDQINGGSDNRDLLAGLEHRIAALTSSLENRERPAAGESSPHIENALQSFSERLDRMSVGNDGTSAPAIAHLEQRVGHLLERIETSSDARSPNMGRVESGLQDILRHLENQHANIATLAESRGIAGSAEPQGNGALIDVFRRELSDVRSTQSETDRRTQDSLEAVHSTLGHVVDRLAMIEGDLRTVRSAPLAPQQPAVMAAAQEPSRSVAPFAPQQLQAKPELPNPAANEAAFATAPREFQAAPPATSPSAPMQRASEVLEPHVPQARPAIEPDLPPDHPLEPGTRPSGRLSSPSERIAASENAISGVAPGAPDQASTSNFIAAARRAAQAAAAAPANDKSTRPAKAAKAQKVSADTTGEAKQPSTVTSKIRSLLVGASVVVIVLGTFKMAMTLLDSGSPPPIPSIESSSDSSAPAGPPLDLSAKPPIQAPVAPAIVPPATLGKQSYNGPSNSDDTASVAIPQTSAPAKAAPTPDVTGSIPAVLQAAPSARKFAQVQIPPTEKLPDLIGGPMLRSAALKGDASAAYEIGVRYAEGKGIAPNLDEAVKWYDRAAQAGVVPATFRLGTLYEKGLGVKKDIDTARRYYMQAAERGNAKAMHNLAVLEADGGGKGANYKNAAEWFRKAADHGVADSQFNLGILYARGIGVEQNLAESFKWFSLAAAQGDVDSGHKRDDIAKRLDAQSLAAAKLAIQTFTAEPQPNDAVNAPTPAGGWDNAPTQAMKPAIKPASTKRAAR